MVGEKCTAAAQSREETGNKFSITSLLPVPPLVNPIRSQEAGCLRDVVPNSQPPWAKNGCGEQTGNAQLHRPCHKTRFTARIRNLPRSHRAQLHYTEPPSPGANLCRRSRGKCGCYNRHFFPKKSILRNSNANVVPCSNFNKPACTCSEKEENFFFQSLFQSLSNRQPSENSHLPRDSLSFAH